MKSNIISLVRYLLIAILFCILRIANISGLHPFVFGMLFALMFCKQNIYILSPIYILTGFLIHFSFDILIIDSVTSLVALVTYFLHFRIKKPISLFQIGLYVFISQLGALFINSSNADMFVNTIISLILGMICLYSYLHILESIIKKGIKRQFTVDEIICLGVTFFAVFVGLYSLPYGQYLSFGIGVFTLLFAGFVFGVIPNIIVSFFIGLALSFASGEYLLLSHFCFLGLGIGGTICSVRVYTAISVVLVDIFSGLYFLPYYTIGQFISVLVGAMIFLCIPKRYLKNVVSFLVKEKEDTAVRNIINQNRQTIYNRLYNLSEVFSNMKNVFLGLVKQTKDMYEISPFLVEDINHRLCSNCPKKDICHKANFYETKENIYNLINLAYERGKVTIVDASPFLTANCNKISILLGYINNVVNDYKSKLRIQENVDEGKMMLSEQMWGVSQIMRSLAQELSLNISFDLYKENKIIEDLMYENIICSEAIIYNQTDNICSVNLIVQNNCLNKQIIAKVVSKTLKLPVSIVNIEKSEKVGYSFVTLQNTNNYDIIFGSARAVKANSEKSGDVFSVIKLKNDKIMLALCDGMGSGEQAEQTSKIALDMIENFYKAGFESDLILNNVNKLLSLSNKETFSATDVCVIDLHRGLCDMIKIGSPISFIKKQQTTQIYDTGALPLGILEEIKPNIYSIVLSDGDMIVLVTDGIVDSFGDVQELHALINEAQTTNPQTIANLILNSAVANNNNFPKDDMTVLVARILSKF